MSTQRGIKLGLCGVAAAGVFLAATSAWSHLFPRAEDVLRRVNEAYAALRPVPRQLDMTFRSRTQRPGLPDTATQGAAKIFQVDRKVRFETLPGSMKTEAAGSEWADGGELVWVHDGHSLRSRYTAPSTSPGETPTVYETIIDHDRVPEEFGSRYTDPMAEPELAAEVLSHPFTLTRESWNGRSVYVLHSQGRIALDDGAQMEMKLWVDAADYLVRRFESESLYAETGTQSAYSVSFQGEFVYHMGVPISDSAFELELGPNAKDVTDLLLQKARSRVPATP